MLRHFTYSDEIRAFYGFPPMNERVFPQPVSVLCSVRQLSASLQNSEILILRSRGEKSWASGMLWSMIIFRSTSTEHGRLRAVTSLSRSKLWSRSSRPIPHRSAIRFLFISEPGQASASPRASGGLPFLPAPHFGHFRIEKT